MKVFRRLPFFLVLGMPNINFLIWRIFTMQKDVFQQMVDRWDAPIVARVEAPRFSGGVVSAKLLANLDAQGIGPKGKLTIGRKVAYEATELAAWLRSRVKEG